MRFVFCAISLFLLASVHCEFMNNLRLAPVLVTRECAYNAISSFDCTVHFSLHKSILIIAVDMS